MKNITSAFHGLEAYSGKKGIHALIRAAHVAAFNRDVWSTTGTLGERTFHASKRDARNIDYFANSC